MRRNILPLVLTGMFGLLELSANAQSPWVLEPFAPFYCSGAPQCVNLKLVRQFQMQPSGAGYVYYDESAMGTSVSYFARTTDNGRTWSESRFAYYQSNPGGTVGYFVRDIWGLPSQTLFAVMSTGAGGGQSSNVVKIAPGNAVTTVFSTAGIAPVLIRFFDENEGFFLTTSFEVYRTTDQGQTWMLQAAPPSGTAGETVNEAVILGNHVWVSSSLGKVWHSADRGLTWGTAANTGIAGYYRPMQLCFSDQQNGLAYVRNETVLKRTTDGGVTWTAVSATGPRRKELIAAVPGAPGTYLSGGSSGSSSIQSGLALSTDSGASWNTIEPTYNYSYLQVLSASQLWAVSSNPQQAFLHSSGNILAARSPRIKQAATAYPNPTTGQMNIPGSAGCTARVFDATGRLVLTKTVSDKAVLDVTTCLPGVYRVLLLDKQGAALLLQVSVAR